MRTILMLVGIVAVISACRMSPEPGYPREMVTGLENLSAYMLDADFVDSSKTKMKLKIRLENDSKNNNHFYDIKLTIFGEDADRNEICRTSKSIKVLKPGEKIIFDLFLQGPSMIHSYKYGFTAVRKMVM